MLSTILIIAAVILLLVLLVPIGMALYQRIKPQPPERPAAPPRPAPPPPRAPEPKGVPDLNPAAPPPPAQAPLPKTDKVTPMTPEQAADATRLKPPANESTRPMPPGGGQPAGTEMLEWYGMLRCTDGPLEGQHFIVEANGIYIGRDASMSQIVVNDSRVSKRHLRILPRDGKVWAIDEGSTNGTFLGGPAGERITEHQLKRGDTLVLAENAATFVYQI